MKTNQFCLVLLIFFVIIVMIIFYQMISKPSANLFIGDNNNDDDTKCNLNDQTKSILKDRLKFNKIKNLKYFNCDKQELLILIHSAVNHHEHREIIREYLNPLQLRGRRWRHLFVVGQKPSCMPLTQRHDCPELGPVGSYLATSEFSAVASVLVVKQYDPTAQRDSFTTEGVSGEDTDAAGSMDM